MTDANRPRRPRGQYIFAIAVTVIAAVIIFFAIRAVPGSQRPTLTHTTTSTSAPAHP